MQILSIFLLAIHAIPAALAADGTCHINSGQRGVCISTGSCRGSGGAPEPGHCPGPTDIQCCTYGSCKAKGVGGLCQPTSTCSGKSTPGFCPGPANIQCCTQATGGGGGHCPSPTVNDATVSLIKDFEKYSPTPYPDPDGNPTIGIGHLCKSSSCSETKYHIPLTLATAAQLLDDDLKIFRDCVTADINNSVKLNPNQYGALVSWAFNEGCGSVKSSTLVKRLNAGENPNTVASEELPKWNKGNNGRVFPGLTRRRAAEVKLFTTPAAGQAHPPIC